MISILRLFFLAVATFLGGLLITFVSPLKLFSPTEKLSYQLAAGIAGVWADFMRWLLTTVKTEYVITGDKLDPKGTYLILANHQSWIDIMMVMVVLGKGTTLPRFFMKWELVYMPVINICAWALDFPIMRRYTQEDIKNRPELKNRDFDYAHEVLSKNPDQACVVVNYAEGTRFTQKSTKRIARHISICLNQKSADHSSRLTVYAIGSTESSTSRWHTQEPNWVCGNY